MILADRRYAGRVAPGRVAGDELEQIAGAWRSWSEHPDAFFAVLHGEVLASV